MHGMCFQNRKQFKFQFVTSYSVNFCIDFKTGCICVQIEVLQMST